LKGQLLMKIQKTFPIMIVLFAMLLAACVPGKTTTNSATDDVMMEKPTEVMQDTSSDTAMNKDSSESMAKDDSMATSTSDAMDQSTVDSTMMETPAWYQAQFVNVNTGETFSINELKGKVVLVETMATWCSNCLKQQKQVKELHQLLGESDELISIGLDIDLNENNDTLKNYVQKQGFDWVYTVASADVAREIGLLYGDQFLNPPSTPIVIIDRQGNAHPLPFGIKDAATLKEAVQPFLDESM
jgi:thiol-disulfide isomerase/thioredoxin